MVYPIGIVPPILNDENMENINDNDPTLDNDAVGNAGADDNAELGGVEASDAVNEDAFDETVNDASTSQSEDYAQTSPPPPIPPQHFAEPSRLTRDPFATFGGVLSGIAHHYGWDVALTRLAFIVIMFLTGGMAFLAYLLAWLVIPRATHWPPAGTRRRGGLGRLSSRDIGGGLVLLGGLIVLGLSTGEAAGVLVPLAIVGAGIWLLIQNPREEVASQLSTADVGAPVNAAYAGSAPTWNDTTSGYEQSGPTAAYYASPPAPQTAPQPVPTRSRSRRVARLAGFTLIGLILLALVAIPVLVIGAIAVGDADFEFNDERVLITPETIELIPTEIDQGAGEVVVDLSNVDFADLEDEVDPVAIDIDLGAGEIIVVVPKDVLVAVNAETELVGELEIFGADRDGLNPGLSVTEEDPQLILDLEVSVGRIEVRRAN